MASDWIKMRPELLREPEVIGIARRLSVSREHVVGCLLCVWGVADAHALSRPCPDDSGTTEGHLSRYCPADIDREAGLAGFATAMIDVGWLVEHEDGVSFPEWDVHNSRSAKTRACEQKKKARQRGNVPISSRSCPDDNGTKPGTREEKRREETNTHTHTRTREEQVSSAPLKTWDAPAGADPIVIAAVDDWQAYRLSVDGRHDSGVRIDALIAEATRKGWAAAKIAASVQFSIAKGAKSWIDSDLDFEQQRKQTQTAKSDRKPTWAERHAMASEGDPF